MMIIKVIEPLEPLVGGMHGLEIAIVVTEVRIVSTNASRRATRNSGIGSKVRRDVGCQRRHGDRALSRTRLDYGPIRSA